MLAHATGDYVFWLDADDVVDRIEVEKLRAVLQQLRAGGSGRLCGAGPCACDPSPDGTGGDTFVDHLRLFPLDGSIRWTYRVHEQVRPTLRRANVPVRWTDLTVRHTGYVDKALRARKLERDSTILKTSWKNGRTIRLCCLTWARLPSSVEPGPRALDFLRSVAWRDRLRPIRSVAQAVCPDRSPTT